jgi:diaminohydroxyphosphoribosylaminopyrimidine deaminase / 5-amino-6-(5-phosphoribosylamino)uracil reductase
MATVTELAAMRRAIALSAFGLGTTSPNPPVGCVTLDAKGQMVGEGYHERKGEAHAEVNALAAAGELARGGTAVVTLEPCNHHGRTPPCRQALLDAGVTRVVVALVDPTSREEGGIAWLRAAGVDVEVGVLAEDARMVLGPWLTALAAQRPQVRWVYTEKQDGSTSGDAIPELSALQSAADAVLWPDGRLEEGGPGAHKPDVFSLPATLAADVPELALADLYQRGVRSVLLCGRSRIAESFAERGLVDEVTAYVAQQPPSFRPSSLVAPQTLAAGFKLVEVANIGGWVRVEGRR